MLADHFPLYQLRIQTPRLELRLPTLAELAALAELAGGGIHDPAVMPFGVAWTDQPPSEVSRSVLQHHWRCLGTVEPDNWVVPFTVFRDGVAIGQQDLSGRQFAITREVATGSWLGRSYHRQGYGTEMRAAVLELAFVGLGAAEATSGAHEDNEASLGVSRRLGYVADGVLRSVVRNQLAVEQRLRLTRTDWLRHRPVAVTVDGVEPCRALLGATAAGHPPAAAAAGRSGPDDAER